MFRKSTRFCLLFDHFLLLLFKILRRVNELIHITLVRFELGNFDSRRIIVRPLFSAFANHEVTVWIDQSELPDLISDASVDWGRIGVTALFWVALPLAGGLIRLHRSDID